MTEKERFSAAVQKMGAVDGGVVSVRDWPATSTRGAYRYADLNLFWVERHCVPQRIAELSALALDIGGHLGLYTYQHIEQVSIMVAVSRDLDETERVGECVDVALEAA